jgi:hypothetical protein
MPQKDNPTKVIVRQYAKAINLSSGALRRYLNLLIDLN